MAATTEQNNSGDRDVEKAFAFRTHKRKKDWDVCQTSSK